MENIVRQELWCHECERYVQFNMDMSIDGNHECHCPNCGHIHYRVVKNGVITDIRYNSQNSVTVMTTFTTSTLTSTYNICTSSNYGSSGRAFLYSSWLTASAS